LGEKPVLKGERRNPPAFQFAERKKKEKKGKTIRHFKLPDGE